MTIPLGPDAAAFTVVWGGLLLGLLLGALAQRTRFCTMGAIADWFSFGGTARMLMAAAGGAGTKHQVLHYGRDCRLV